MDLDATSVSAIVAAAGVMIGVILTIQELRHLHRQRYVSSLPSRRRASWTNWIKLND